MNIEVTPSALIVPGSLKSYFYIRYSLEAYGESFLAANAVRTINFATMKKILFSIPLFFFIISCGNKKEETSSPEDIFPVLDFIKSQVAHVDTSFYQIVKLDIIDSTRTDTTYVKREDFRSLAKDFLELPNLEEKEYRGRFSEKRFFDESLNRIIVTCLPKDPSEENMQRQELVVTPDPFSEEGKVNSIIVHLLINSRDSAVEKKLLWQADRSFQVTTITQKPDSPEKITTTKVVWNEQENL